MQVTKETMAGWLDKREIGEEITEQEARHARESGLVVLFGASDDLVELRGAIEDESGADGGTVFKLDQAGIVPDWLQVDHDDEDECREYFARSDGNKSTVTAKWCAEGDYSWTYETAIPHATFEVVENKQPYCRGIVFELAALPAAKQKEAV